MTLLQRQENVSLVQQDDITKNRLSSALHLGQGKVYYARSSIK